MRWVDVQQGLGAGAGGALAWGDPWFGNLPVWGGIFLLLAFAGRDYRI